MVSSDEMCKYANEKTNSEPFSDKGKPGNGKTSL